MNGTHLEIISDGTPIGTKIMIDGKPADNILDLVISVGPDQHMMAKMTMYVDKFTLAGKLETDIVEKERPGRG